MNSDDAKPCRNDCVESLSFPKRLHNRPGLTHLNYRIGSYANIREFLLRRLDREPLLAAWTHREADDPGIALLEGAAILGDILTFYQNLYANEAYLRTAQWRESIGDLVRLLGYQLSPGIGGKATFAFGVKGSTPVVIPAHFPIKAQLVHSDKPVDFATLREFIAEPVLSLFALYRPFVQPHITNGRKTFAVETAQLSSRLEVGDRLMLVKDPDSSQTPRQIVVIDEVKEKFDHTEITIAGSWQNGNVNRTTMTAYKLGRSFRHFGYNAPPTAVVGIGENATQLPVVFIREVCPPGGVTVPVTTLKTRFGSFLTESTLTASTTLSSPSAQSRPISNSVTEVLASTDFLNQTPSNSLTLFSKVDLLSDRSTRETVSVATLQSDPFLGYITRIPPLSVLPIYSSALDTSAFPLDQTVDDLSSGSTLLISLQLSSSSTLTNAAPHFFAATIAHLSTVSATYGTITGGTTVVTLKQPIGTSILRYTDIRSIEFQEVIGSPFLILSPREPDAAASNAKLFYYGDGLTYKALEARSLQLVKGQQIEQVMVGIDRALTIPDEQMTLRPLTLQPALQKLTLADFPLEPMAPVSVYGNLVEANQGKAEPATVLGNGDSRQMFQTFKLPKAPLTYFNSPGETPPEVPELQIYVNDRLWKRVPSLFDRQAREEIYIVREDADGDSWVQFGDGKTGARLPSGLNNVVATYRVGTGAYGALEPETTVRGGKLDRLDKIWLLDIATGGEAPETGENAREAAPGKIQSLGRLVSLKDFEQETLALQGVTKATAAWGLLEHTPMVMLTVLMARGREREIQEIRQTLNTNHRCRGSQRFPVHVRSGYLRYVYLDVTIGIAPTFQSERVRREIQVAIGVTGEEGNGLDGSAGLFGLRRRRFGEPEYETRIAATLQNVAGVMWVKVTAFGLLEGAGNDPLSLNLPDSKLKLSKLTIAANEILSLHTTHCQSQLVATVSQEVC